MKTNPIIITGSIGNTSIYPSGSFQTCPDTSVHLSKMLETMQVSEIALHANQDTDKEKKEHSATASSVFIRSKKSCSSIEGASVKHSSTRRISNWLSFLYPNATINTPCSRTPSPLESSDVESETIKSSSTSPSKIISSFKKNSTRKSRNPASIESTHTTSSTPKAIEKNPKKGILKTLSATQDVMDVDFPEPIQKSTFLRREEMNRLSTFASKLEAINLTNQPVSRKPRIRFGRDRRHEAWGHDEYDRTGIDYVARFLTPELALLIKRELNEVKLDMEVHETSRKYTQFYRLP